jgi:hypothetical protein
MPDRRTREPDPRAYQRKFFPLVSYPHHILAGVVGGIVGALYVFAAGRGDYLDVVLGSALSAQLLLGGFALIRQRWHAERAIGSGTRWSAMLNHLRGRPVGAREGVSGTDPVRWLPPSEDSSAERDRRLQQRSRRWLLISAAAFVVAFLGRAVQRGGTSGATVWWVILLVATAAVLVTTAFAVLLAMRRR